AWVNHTEVRLDGFLLGKNGKPYPPATPLSKLPGVEPQNGRSNDRTVIFTNGAFITHQNAALDMQAIANETGSRVLGLYNATQSPWADAVQELDDELGIGDNKAADSLAAIVYRE